MNNGKTEEALIIRSKMNAHGFKLVGLPEMKKSEQVLLVKYLQANEFDQNEMRIIAKFFGCKLYSLEES